MKGLWRTALAPAALALRVMEFDPVIIRTAIPKSRASSRRSNRNPQPSRTGIIRSRRISFGKTLCLLKTPKAAKSLEFWDSPP